jgi:hypothetical protein
MSLLDNLTHLYQTIPVVKWALDAHMALSADCCQVSSLGRLDRAIVEAKAFCSSGIRVTDPQGIIAAMVLITQTSVSISPDRTLQSIRYLANTKEITDESKIPLDTPAGLHSMSC